MPVRKQTNVAKAAADRNDPVASRMRERRAALGWSLGKLARASGLRSPSYVFHIENGQKVPSDQVALRLAEALGEDPELYRAWARARCRTDLSTVLESADTLRRLLAQTEWGLEQEGPRTTAGPAGAVLRLPVLEEGTDPDGPGAGAIDWIHLDLKILPPGEAPGQPFAYRLTAHGVRRVPELLRPGDCVVISRTDEPPMSDAAYAVRIGPRVELSRVQLLGEELLLPGAARGREPERLETPGGAPARSPVVGKVVVAFRRWL